jgi:hypothetical protein
MPAIRVGNALTISQSSPHNLPVVGVFPPSLCKVMYMSHKVFVDKRVDKRWVGGVNIRAVFEMR